MLMDKNNQQLTSCNNICLELNWIGNNKKYINLHNNKKNHVLLQLLELFPEMLYSIIQAC